MPFDFEREIYNVHTHRTCSSLAQFTLIMALIVCEAYVSLVSCLFFHILVVNMLLRLWLNTLGVQITDGVSITSCWIKHIQIMHLVYSATCLFHNPRSHKCWQYIVHGLYFAVQGPFVVLQNCTISACVQTHTQPYKSWKSDRKVHVTAKTPFTVSYIQQGKHEGSVSNQFVIPLKAFLFL